MEEGLRPEWLVFGLLFAGGLLFWVIFLLSTSTWDTLVSGGRWLEWRPLPSHLPKAMLAAFLTGFVLQQLFGGLLLACNLLDFLPVGITMLVPVVFFQGLMSLVLYRVLHGLKLNPLEILGLEEPFRGSDLVWGSVGFCMSLPVVAFANMLTEWLFRLFQWPFDLQPVMQVLSDVEGWMNWLSLFLLVGFIVPLLEELVFRGFLYTWLHQKIGTLPGLFLQAVIFALIHQHGASILPLFTLALLLGLIYTYTRRLMACVWVHAFFNTMTLIYTFFLAPGELLT